MKSYHSEINSGNEKFDNVMNTLVDLDIEYTAMQMIFTPRPIHPGKDKLAPFYSDIINESVVFNSNILKLPKGFSTLGMHQLYKSIYVYTDTNRKLASIKMVHSIENDDIKAYYAIDQLRMYKFYNKEYLDYITPLRSAISKFPDLVKIVADHEEEIRVFEKGTPGVEFTFKDINDKDVSFSDFRGKYVYIDFWATWCSPCKKEIPSLKKLENKFHGKDIVFVSISMDKPKVHGKWKEFVKKEGLTGVQLFATDAFNTQVAKEYKINSIPRFMLFDKEGKVVENNAMRPSNPEIEMQLKSLL
jgi:thiol-disulfide isomerase/thioredoxin